MATKSADPCPVCGGKAGLFFRSRLGWGVRSNWTLLAVGAVVLRCSACGHLFKPADLVKRCSDYQHAYRIYGNRATDDTPHFEAGRMVSRSDTLLAYVRRHGLGRSSMLDYGCHRGAFLAALPRGAHAGYDIAETYRPMVEGLGYAYYTPRRPPPRLRFEVLSIVHVLEHLGFPARDIRAGLAALAPGGRVLVQLPDPLRQPTDLYVLDHRSHFLPAALNLAMARAGLSVVHAPRRLLAGEWTALYRKGRPTAARRLEVAPGQSRRAQDSILTTLSKGEETLLELRRSSQPCVVYGAGFLGSLVAAVLGEAAVAFADDNPALWTADRDGRPVAALDKTSPKASVVVAVPPSAAARVARKCRAAGRRVMVPFAAP